MDAIDTIYQKYEAKDYWGNTMIIKRQKQARDQASSPLLDQTIEKYYRAKSRQFCYRRHAQIQVAISACDIDWLKRHVRYDQQMSLDMFELITGQKVKRLSNKKLAVVFEEVCKGET